MPITAKIEGMNEISEALTKLEEEAPKAAAMGLYAGAGVMSKAIQQGADGIRTEPFKYVRNGTRQPSPEEKAALAGAIGIAKFDKNGSEINTSVGFGNAGYADVAGHERAVAQIANAINSGTSFMTKQPFFRKAVSKGTREAEKAIVSEIEKRVDALAPK